MVEFLKSLVSVGRRVLSVENQDNVHESNTNVKENLKRLYLSISYISRAGSTKKSKVTSTKHSLRPSDVWFREKDRTNIRNIVVDTGNSKSSQKNEADRLNDALLMLHLLLLR